MSQRILVIFGTRPEAIKLIPVVRALQARAGIVVQTLATGQHDVLLEQVLALHRLRPDLQLDLIRRDDSLDALHASLLLSIGDALELVRPDMVVVQGDTATAHAGALAAVHRQIPVAHVEAGLRSGNTAHPWPEEHYRRAIADYSALHFAPTPAAAAALGRECIDPATVLMTGNTIVDALAAVRARVALDPELAAAAQPILAAADGRALILATAHRRENAKSLHAIVTALKKMARDSGALVVMVRHPNAAASDDLARLLGVANLVVTDPLDHAAFVTLLDRASLVLTDSGGVQEEAVALNTPVLVLRETTERPEGVDCGLARLTKLDPAAIVSAATEMLANPPSATGQCPYGDGRAAERIADALIHGIPAAAKRASTLTEA
ncbi:UDP-N-acetylglucosamine 2-epimerase [Sphingomonas antarctica]|uniref:non-hydrolyzing UDP-N-acetylglucosamine 2-epimerase n=1 Tax=Sphingomonas antarctica TaxID=2040274 RepID=UPI0039E9CF90